MRILLIQPENKRGLVGFRTAALPEPLALEMLAATVADHEVMILDLRLDDSLVEVLQRFAPDVVGVTALTTEVYAARDAMQTAKQWSPEVFTVVGGHHATLLPVDFYQPYVDAIGLGEGELVFPQLIEALAAGQELDRVPNLTWRDAEGTFIHNGRTFSSCDIDSLAIPRRDLTSQYRDQYFWLFDKPDTSVATGRGCPHRCNFCSVWEFYGGRVRQMSVDRVLQEVRGIESRHMTFVDDNFLLNNRREAEIAARIKAEGIQHGYCMECRTDSIVRHPELLKQWADIGMWGVLLGLEGVSDRTLQRVNKKNTRQVNDEAIRILQDNGIVIWGAFIVDPDWTADEFQELRDYVHRMQIAVTQFTVLTPLPGTQLYRDESARLLTRDYTCYDAMHAVVPTRLPREKFYELFASLYNRNDLDPYMDMINRGAMTMENFKQLHKIGKSMSRPEFFMENDPILGRRQPPEPHFIKHQRSDLQESYAASFASQPTAAAVSLQGAPSPLAPGY